MNKYYKILGLPVGASKKMIRAAFRKLAKKYHPDVNEAADANAKFLEITEAYDYLYYGKRPRRQIGKPSKPHKPSPPRETAEEKLRRYAKARAKQAAERDKKEKEFFENSQFHDIFLILGFLGKLAALFLAFLFVILPIFGLIIGKPFQGYMVIFVIIGLGLGLFVYTNWTDYFKIGKLNYKLSDFKKLFVSNANTRQNCFFTEGKYADGSAYRIRFYRAEEIKTRVSTPLNHKVRIKSTVRLVHVSRNLFAFKVHIYTKLIRIFSIVFSILLLPIDSFVWQVFFGILASVLINQMIYFFTKVKSDFYFLTNYYLFIRLGFVLITMFFATDFSNFAFVHSEALGIWLFFLFMFSDMIITPMVVEIPNNKLLRPLGKKKYPKITKLLDEEFQIGYVESIPCAFYVVIKWFF